MKRRALGLLLACAAAAAFFGIGCSLGLSALFQREKTRAVNGHCGIIDLLAEDAPAVDPGANAYLRGDPRGTLIRVLNAEEYRKLAKRGGACPIRHRYMTLGVSGEYRRMPPPAGYYDYGDRLIVESSVRAAGRDSLALADCEFLGGKREAMEETITAELPEDLADTWRAGDRGAFSLRVRWEDGAWRYRADPELVPGGSLSAEAAADMAEDNLHGFDVVFTEDMGWICRVIQGELRCVQGRMIEEADAGSRVCVVSERFLRENGLAPGDSLRLRLGDKLCPQFAPIGAVAYTADQYPGRWTEETFTIVGSFEDTDNGRWTAEEFACAYSESTVFVPLSALPETVSRSSVRYTPAELSLLSPGGGTLARRLEWMRETAAALRLRCVADDRGWPSIAAGISAAEAGLRAKVLPILAGAVLLLALVYPVLLLETGRKCTILRLAGAPEKRIRKRSLLPSLVLLWAAAGVGAAGALLFLRGRAASLYASWGAFFPLSGQGPALPSGILPVMGAISFALSGGILPAARMRPGRDARGLRGRLGRKGAA